MSDGTDEQKDRAREIALKTIRELDLSDAEREKAERQIEARLSAVEDQARAVERNALKKIEGADLPDAEKEALESKIRAKFGGA